MFKNKKAFSLRRLAETLLLSATLFVSAALPAHAAGSASGGGNGFLISPVTSEITVNKGQSQTVDVSIQNPTDSTVVAQAVVNDFIASSDESGTPRLLLNNNTPLPTNNFKSLVSPIPNTTLAPNQKVYLSVTISVPSNARSGGYYGAVRFVPINSGQKKANVGLTASVGTLFLVTVPGNLVEKLNLVQLSAAHPNGNASSLITSGKVDVLTRLDNVGDIHVQPFGNIIIKNMFGKQIANIQFNNTNPRGNILPDSIRKFVNPISNKSWFGHYTIEANIAYQQGTGNLITASASFWYLPLWFIILVIVVIVLIVALIYWLIVGRRRHHPKRR